MNYLNKAFNKEQATAVEKYVAAAVNAALAKIAPVVQEKDAAAVVKAKAVVKPLVAEPEAKKAPVSDAAE
jgi:L-lactate utilization protein LutB